MRCSPLNSAKAAASQPTARPQLCPSEPPRPHPGSRRTDQRLHWRQQLSEKRSRGRRQPQVLQGRADLHPAAPDTGDEALIDALTPLRASGDNGEPVSLCVTLSHKYADKHVSRTKRQPACMWSRYLLLRSIPWAQAASRPPQLSASTWLRQLPGLAPARQWPLPARASV